MGTDIALLAPGVQLHVGVGGERRHGAGVAAQAGEHLRQLRGALVEPRVLVAVQVPVDHVLELVGEHGVVGSCARRQGVDVHEHHLRLITVGVGEARVLVSAEKVADGPSEARVEDHDAGVAVDAGVPLGAKGLAQRGIGVGVKGAGRGEQRLAIHLDALLDPHLGVLREHGERRGDLVGARGVRVAQPKASRIPLGEGHGRAPDDAGDGLLVATERRYQRHIVARRHGVGRQALGEGRRRRWGRRDGRGNVGATGRSPARRRRGAGRSHARNRRVERGAGLGTPAGDQQHEGRDQRQPSGRGRSPAPRRHQVLVSSSCPPQFGHLRSAVRTGSSAPQ